MLRRQLPSANSLFVFEAVARLGSFSAAAQEMNVTQPAISNAVAKLERYIEATLFLRSNGATLTNAGEILFAAVSGSWTKLETALNEIRQSRYGQKYVTLSISASQMVNWLLPKMPKLEKDLPDIALQFQMTGNDPSGPIGDADLAVRYGKATQGKVHVWPFSEERIYAVCSESYQREYGGLGESLNKGNQHTLISLSDPRITWREFFQASNIAEPHSYRALEFPEYSIVLQSCINGQGIALGWVSSVVNLLASGTLVAAFKKPLVTGEIYCLVADSHRPLRQSVIRLRDWLTAEMQSDASRYSFDQQ